MREDSLLERVAAAARGRHLSENTLIAYRRTWLKIWSAAEGFALETLPAERAGEFYEEATRGRSASHHLQVKAALALLYRSLAFPIRFSECQLPNSSRENRAALSHGVAIGAAPARVARGSPQLLWTPNVPPGGGALLYRLPVPRLGKAHDRTFGPRARWRTIAARLQVKGGSFRDLPLTGELAASLEEWFAFLESVKGVRLRGGGIEFAGSPLIFPAGTARPSATRHSTPGSSSRASAPGAGHFRASPAADGRDAVAQRARGQPARRAGASGTQEPGDDRALHPRR